MWVNGPKSFEPGSDKVIFEIDVSAGEPTTLTPAFVDNDNKVLCGAYYIYIKKLEGSAN